MRPELPQIQDIWVYLAGTPLFALVLTLFAYSLGLWIYERTDKHPMANPVMIALVLVSSVLLIGDVSYQSYFAGAQFVHFLLGTATVALAIPIYKGLASMQGRMVVLLSAMLAGGATSIVVAVGVLKLMGVSDALVSGMYAKSVTAPIAMGLAERLHASPTLTAVFAVITGVLGAVLGRFVLNALSVTAWWQRGFALGVASHGIGTSRAFSVHPVAGAYASLGMGMHGVISAIVLPIIFKWIIPYL